MAMIVHPHIKLDEQGAAWIDDANRGMLDVEIASQEQTAHRLRREAGDSPLVGRLPQRVLWCAVSALAMLSLLVLASVASPQLV